MIWQRLTTLFPLWVSLASIGALLYPPLFIWFKGSMITTGLGIIMLGMGLTLEWKDFKAVALYPKWVLCGIFLQYSIMPLLGWGLSVIFSLPTELAVGLILVSCCPGGTASNVIAFLSKSNVALSVSMTAISTLGAAIATPTLTTLLVGSRMNVDTWGLFISTFKVVILPVLIGVLLNRFFHSKLERVTRVSPFIAVLFIVLIVASIIGQGRQMILESGLQLLASVFSLHILGFVLGYALAIIVTKNVQVARTVSIEVGMQNSGLGVVLARQNFTNPATAIPSAISSLSHCLIGSFVASIWGKTPTNQT